MTTSPAPQFVKYTFYQVDPAWRRLPVETRAQDKRELADVIGSASPPMTVRTYSLMGMRADADIMVWTVSPDLEHVQALATGVAATRRDACAPGWVSASNALCFARARLNRPSRIFCAVVNKLVSRTDSREDRNSSSRRSM